MDAPTGPTVVGCARCGVPDKVARYWPEAYRALARELDTLKADELGRDEGGEPPEVAGPIT